MGTLKELLQKVIVMIDNDEFELNECDIELISCLIHRPLTMGREDAAKFMGVSLNRFHELKDLGIIAEPRKRKGFKEKEYYVSDLQKALKIKQARGL